MYYGRLIFDQSHSLLPLMQVFAAKLLVNWLVGDSTLEEKAALPVIRMFISIILNNGDLLEKEHIRCFMQTM